MKHEEQVQAVREMFPAVHAEMELLRADVSALEARETMLLDRVAKLEAENAELRSLIEVHETLAKSASAIAEVGDRLKADQESEIEALTARVAWFEEWERMVRPFIASSALYTRFEVEAWERANPRPPEPQ